MTRVQAVVLLAVMLGIGGCAAPSPSEWRPGWADDPFGGVPEDLTLEVTIQTGRQYPERTEAHLRPGRWILYPDGSLHYDGVYLRDGDRRPGLVRTLSRDQVAHLWAVADRLGLSDPTINERIGNVEIIRPGRDEIVYSMEMWAWDEHWSLLRRAGSDETPDAAAAEFIRTLAALAWATDLPDVRQRYLPRRYDFGPDPYERYRPAPDSSPDGRSDAGDR